MDTFALDQIWNTKNTQTRTRTHTHISIGSRNPRARVRSTRPYDGPGRTRMQPNPATSGGFNLYIMSPTPCATHTHGQQREPDISSARHTCARTEPIFYRLNAARNAALVNANACFELMHVLDFGPRDGQQPAARKKNVSLHTCRYTHGTRHVIFNVSQYAAQALTPRWL